MSINQYTAGLMDGEGSVSLVLANKKYGTRQPEVSLTSTTYELVGFLKDNYGGYIRNHTAKKGNWNQAWVWSIRGRKAIAFLKQIRPFMLEPEKVRRADLLINKYHLVTKSGLYTKEEHAKKIEFQEEFFKFSRSSHLKKDFQEYVHPRTISRNS